MAAPHCRTVLQSWQNKTRKTSINNDSIILNTPQNIIKISGLEKLLWKANKDASQKSSWSQMSLSISRSSDSFSTVSPIVNGRLGMLVRYLETIIVLVLLIFNFILQRSHSHHSLTLSRSRFGDSSTATVIALG